MVKQKIMASSLYLTALQHLYLILSMPLPSRTSDPRISQILHHIFYIVTHLRTFCTQCSWYLFFKIRLDFYKLSEFIKKEKKVPFL